MRDYNLSHLVRNFMASLEIARLFVLYRSQASSAIPVVKDPLGNEIALINGTSIAELLTHQGYAHAKDRIFQMDIYTGTLNS